MKVLYCGNFRAAHSTENEVRRALEHLGHIVIQLQEDEMDWAGLAGLAKTWGADLFMWTRTWPTSMDTGIRALNRLEDDGVPSVMVHLDRWWGLEREHQISDEPIFRCDLVATADGGHDAEWAAAGIDHVWFPPAVSHFECVPAAPDRRVASDIAFVGSWRGYHPEWPHRQELVEWLRRTYRGRVRFWPKPGARAVRGPALRTLYASVKVLVGDSCLVPNRDGTPVTHYHSDRIPETLGRGGFLVHPEVEGVTDGSLYTDGQDLGTWVLGDWAGLKSEIDFALANTELRRLLANQGREHVLANHTYARRMGSLLATLAERGLISEEALA